MLNGISEQTIYETQQERMWLLVSLGESVVNASREADYWTASKLGLSEGYVAAAIGYHIVANKVEA